MASVNQFQVTFDLEADCARLVPRGAARVRLLAADGVDES